MRDTPSPSPVERRGHEPALNAPWILLALIGVLLATHAARLLTGVSVERFALTAADLRAGRWFGLVTYLFVHGSWAHVGMNGVFILAFGTPVARFLGGGARGAVLFIAFFLVCGAIAALAYAGWLDALGSFGVPGRGWALVGASGAGSGLMGGAARLIEGRGRLGSIGGKMVMGMSVAWIGANVLLGLSGLTPGAAGLPVAWEAHIFGYFAGLALIGLFARVAARPATLAR
ncbi:MAG: rhomboid family intramembrane serine protease [Caulobacteraceae bacterium]